jgi:hypothetical protein
MRTEETEETDTEGTEKQMHLPIANGICNYPITRLPNYQMGAFISSTL